MRLGDLAEKAEHERRGRATRYSGTPRLLRTLRRLRHDTDMLRRAGRDIGTDTLPASIAAPWCEAAESTAETLRGIERLLAGGKVPEDFDTLTPAVRAYLDALEDIRKSAEAATLPPATLRRMFGIGFTLDQFRRDIGDMIEIAQEVPKPAGARLRGASDLTSCRVPRKALRDGSRRAWISYAIQRVALSLP